jgi:hypothetical protein
MKPGQWAQLLASGLTEELLTDEGGYNIFEYSNKLYWYSRGRKMMFIGGGHRSRTQKLIEYDEATNDWALATTRALGIHSYDSFTVDASTGWLYSLPVSDAGPFQRWDGLAWSSLGRWPGYYPSCVAIAHFPERNEIWAANGYRGADLRYFDLATGAWARKPGSYSWKYQNFMVYLPAAKKLFTGCGGDGNGAMTNWYSIDAAAGLTRLADAPRGFVINQSIVIAAPDAPRILAWHFPTAEMFSYDATSNEWTTEYSGSSQHPFDLRGEYRGADMVAGPIPEYGVIMFAAYNGGVPQTWLYKPVPARTRPNP